MFEKMRLCAHFGEGETVYFKDHYFSAYILVIAEGTCAIVS
jgi:hypothetical protein